MLKVDTITKDWKEAGSFPAQLNLYGFWDEHCFLTKTGDVGSVLKIEGVGYESLDHAGRDYAIKRLEAALRSLDDRTRLYQILFKRNRPDIPHAEYENPLVRAKLLIMILCLYGWKEIREVIVKTKTQSIIEGMANQSKLISFSEIRGIDITGHQIDSSLMWPMKSVVFVLHGDTLTNDLDFWDRTAKLLVSQTDIGLVGFCDSRLCAQTLEKKPELAFTVGVCGNVTAIEALLNADANGKAVFRVKGKTGTKRIAWSGPGNSPEELAQEVMQ